MKLEKHCYGCKTSLQGGEDVKDKEEEIEDNEETILPQAKTGKVV